MLNKLRKPENKSTYKIILANSDAVDNEYSPNPKEDREGEYFVFIINKT